MRSAIASASARRRGKRAIGATAPRLRLFLARQRRLMWLLRCHPIGSCVEATCMRFTLNVRNRNFNLFLNKNVALRQLCASILQVDPFIQEITFDQAEQLLQNPKWLRKSMTAADAGRPLPKDGTLTQKRRSFRSADLAARGRHSVHCPHRGRRFGRHHRGRRQVIT